MVICIYSEECDCFECVHIMPHEIMLSGPDDEWAIDKPLCTEEILCPHIDMMCQCVYITEN